MNIKDYNKENKNSGFITLFQIILSFEKKKINPTPNGVDGFLVKKNPKILFRVFEQFI